ncbi:MAG: class I SAM-dependent methyltransferase [Bryobacteraceae bacterium]
MAAGYAAARPLLHSRILCRALPWISGMPVAGLALDAGCGAGLSTRALLRHVAHVAGMDAAMPMVRLAARLLPAIPFFVARMEQLPLPDSCCSLITAAGSLNYTDVPAALREAARVLAPGGALIVYDFAPGSRFPEDPSLARWFQDFLARYPKPDDGAITLDAPTLCRLCAGRLEPVAAQVFEEQESWDARSYANYLMTETNVAAALAAGESAARIRAWMNSTLPAVFGGARRTVCFDGYFAAFAKPSSSSTRPAP